VSGGGEECRTGSGSRGAGAGRPGRNVAKAEVDHSAKGQVEGSEGQDGVSTPTAVGLIAVSVGENGGGTGGKRACEARLLASQGGRRGFGRREGTYAMSTVRKRVPKRGEGVAGGGRDGENGTGGGHVSLAKTRTPGASRG